MASLGLGFEFRFEFGFGLAAAEPGSRRRRSSQPRLRRQDRLPARRAPECLGFAFGFGRRREPASRGRRRCFLGEGLLRTLLGLLRTFLGFRGDGSGRFSLGGRGFFLRRLWLGSLSATVAAGADGEQERGRDHATPPPELELFAGATGAGVGAGDRAQVP